LGNLAHALKIANPAFQIAEGFCMKLVDLGFGNGPIGCGKSITSALIAAPLE
jgi:hypothetical protein